MTIATSLKHNEIQVIGRVQGVGFRYFTKLLADELGVYGYIWNASDGSVYIQATAPKEIMDLFLEKVKTSPAPMGKVTKMIVNTLDHCSAPDGFYIISEPHI